MGTFASVPGARKARPNRTLHRTSFGGSCRRLETMTAYLMSPAYRTIPALLLLVAVMYVRPRGLLGRR